MPTVKNWFHILVLHLKKHVVLKKSPFHLDVLLLDLYQKLNQKILLITFTIVTGMQQRINPS